MRDLNELAVFSAVVQHGGFTAAAKALGMQKSTLSRMVTRLESRLATRLLLRTSRQLSVTEAGHSFLARCDEGLRLLDLAEGVVEPVDQAVGSVRLTAMPDFAERYLAPLVARFALEQPRIRSSSFSPRDSSIWSRSALTSPSARVRWPTPRASPGASAPGGGVSSRAPRT